MSKSKPTVFQGEIWLADLNPSVGREQSGLRPVVIVSGNMLNKHMPLVFAVPLTTKVRNYKGNPVMMPNEENGLTKESEILVFQIRTISQQSLEKRIGKVKQLEVDQIIHTLNDLLTY
jgi:mRNA interferase MazF